MGDQANFSALLATLAWELSLILAIIIWSSHIYVSLVHNLNGISMFFWLVGMEQKADQHNSESSFVEGDVASVFPPSTL